MIILGLILLILGILFGIGILETLGIILLLVGLTLFLIHPAYGPIRGRWW